MLITGSGWTVIKELLGRLHIYEGKESSREEKENVPVLYSQTEFPRLVLRLRLDTPSHTATLALEEPWGKCLLVLRRPCGQ